MIEKIALKTIIWGHKMAWPVKVLVVKADNPSGIPKPHMVEEKRLP